MESELYQVVLDLETMSTHNNAAIVSIGAVKILPPTTATLGSVIDRFYRNVDLASSQDAGLHVESRTVRWWSEQSEAARAALKVEPVEPLIDALLAFSKWFGEPKSIWSNPATFDLVILENAYRAVGLSLPFEFYNTRCYRTLKAEFPELVYERPFIQHDALQDAEAQAKHLLKIQKRLLDLRVQDATNQGVSG